MINIIGENKLFTEKCANFVSVGLCKNDYSSILNSIYFDNIVSMVNYNEKNSQFNFYVICDLESNDILHEILYILNSSNNYIFLKTNIEAGTCSKLSNIYKNLHLIFFPDTNLDFVLLGTSGELNTIDYQKIFKFIRTIIYGNIEIYIKSYAETEIVCISLHAYSACKKIFIKEINEICDNHSLDFNSIKRILNVESETLTYDEMTSVCNLSKLQEDTLLMDAISERITYFNSKMW